MASNQFQTFRFNSQVFAYALRNITVRSSVETITAHTILLVQFVRDSIQICMLRHSLVECSIEYTDLRNIRQNSCNGVNSFQVSRIVERCQIIAGSKSLKHFLSQQYWFTEAFTSVHHTMTYGIDFFEWLDSTIFGTYQCIQDEFHTYGMFGDILLQNFLFTIRQSQFQEWIFQTDLFDTTLGNHFFAVHIEQLVFDRWTTTVQY